MKRIIYIFIFPLLLSSCEKPINEFQSHNFVKYFGNGIESVGYDVIQLDDGSYVLTGYDKSSEGNDNQILIVKTDIYGNQIWNSTYGVTTARETGKVIKEGLDGYYIAGTSVIAGPSGGKDSINSFILKVGLNGDSVWYKEFSSDAADIEFNDILISDSHIYVAGQITFSSTNSDIYALELNLDGELTKSSAPLPSVFYSYKKVFFVEGNLIFVGEDRLNNTIVLVPMNMSSWQGDNTIKLNSSNETFGDAVITNDALYILSNNQSGAAVVKLDFDYNVVWKTETISFTELNASIEGKSFAIKENGDIIILGESGLRDTRLIHTFNVSSDGALLDESIYKTIPGSVVSAKETTDGGIIFIGSTPKVSYGITVQLIKTDADLYLLKP